MSGPDEPSSGAAEDERVAPSRGSSRIALAAVAGAHGIQGELRLKLFTDAPDKLRQFERLYVDGILRRLIAIRQSGHTPIAKFDGITDRGSAEALRGTLVEVDRSELPPLGDDEYYHSDLIGLCVIDGEGRAFGAVVAVENYGAGDILEIADEHGKHSMIPFRRGIADLEGGRVVIDPLFLA
jgi:16S rRNA processing protein RimM